MVHAVKVWETHHMKNMCNFLWRRGRIQVVRNMKVHIIVYQIYILTVCIIIDDEEDKSNVDLFNNF